MNSPDPSFDEMIEALSRRPRRRLLVELLDRDGWDGTPSEAACADGGTGPDEFRVAMRHVHLPKLEEYGFVRWDRRSDEVSRGPAFDRIRPLLELLVEYEDELPADWV